MRNLRSARQKELSLGMEMELSDVHGLNHVKLVEFHFKCFLVHFIMCLNLIRGFAHIKTEMFLFSPAEGGWPIKLGLLRPCN